MQKKPAAFALSFAVAFVLGAPAWSQSGYQTINGTRVFTQVDQARGVATFSNDCGRQTLTQSELQAGAIPRQIIPCPRPGPSTAEKDRSDCQFGIRNFYILGFPGSLYPWRDKCIRGGMANEYARAAAQAAINQKRDEAAEAAKAKELAEYPSKCAEAKAALEKTLWPAYLDGIRQGHNVDSLYEKKKEPENLIFWAGSIGDGHLCSEERAWYRQAYADFNEKVDQASAARAAASRPTSVEKPAPSRLPEPALPPVRVAQQPLSAEKPAPPRLPEPALPPPARSVQQPTPSVEKAARSRLPEPALPPLAASKQLASRETMNQPPLPQGQAVGPIVDANSLRAQQGTCSDITGVGGGPGPSNCQQNNGIPSNVQAQINQARASSQKLNPSQQDLQSAAQRYRQVEATLRAAGDLANAAIAADQALKLEDALATPAAATQDSCPPIGPEAYWRGTANEEYCGHAKCLERGSAYYGMVCFPPDRQKAASRNEEKKCLEKLGFLRGRNLAEGEIEILMGNAGCKPDGTPMSLRDRLKWVLRHKDFAVGEPDPFVTIDPKYKFCTTDYAAPPGSGISICWLEAGNGYCKKWREKPDGSKLPFDYVKADKQGFSDDVVNASIYTQHCPEGADRKWIDFWAQSKN